MGIVQCSSRIASNELVSEHIEDRRIGQEELSLVKLFVAVFEELAVQRKKSHDVLYFRIIVTQLLRQRNLGYRPGECIVRFLNIGHDPVNAFRIFVIPVVTQLIEDIQCKEEATGNTDSQSKDIDSTIDFVLK